MANIRSEAATLELHRKILTAATELFIKKGFERTTIADIAKISAIPKSKILYEMNSKEEILVHLVDKFLDGVTEASDAVSTKLTDDKLLIFMANEVLQIYMAEMSEDMRNLYLAAYSMPKTSEAVLRRRSEMLFEKFGYLFPSFALKDYYELEIATMGIMRAYMSVPCDMYFTIEAKIDRLISTMLKIYDVDEATIIRTREFISKINFEEIANKAVADVFKDLEIKSAKKH
ncbi:MAG: TetR/AcrR family transcriptional regulator [Clostridia bacterium]|nr:TetR/AcrR family transcriptional regulator [Clostridia bacterium]